jgi:predicted Abi (CAAX) family protease
MFQEFNLRPALQRAMTSLRTWPSRKLWLECLRAFLLYAGIALFLGVSLGYFRFEFTQDSPARLLRFAAIALLVPCLTEELFFRAMLLPDPKQIASSGSVLARTFLALVLFVAWHPLNGMLWKTAARQTFLDPVFLLLSTLLGGCSTFVYLRTASIWPSTLIHWFSLICWKAFLGGRIF